ncbi:MAG TPA: serine/threonine-protein kinase, partial [Fimbriiglobus sp.]|nr:serine/threonine-protein kinase [Fimbriiglobus sp.]
MPETTDPARGADPIDAQPTVTLPPALEAVAVTLTVDGNRVALTQPPTRAPEIPGYQIIEELGRGGMGVVYHAVQVRLNRPVALKMILAGEFAGAAERVRFMTEAEVIARLHHPNIVQLYEFNVHNGVPYFSLEFVDGGTLERRLARQPLAPAEAAALLETLARAIQYAHDHSVVHRDLKPSNILLEPLPQNGSGPPTGGQSSHRHLHGNSSFGTLSCVVRETAVVPKVTDFGLAKTSAGSTGLTQSGAIMGTPSYMAPEQAEGKGREVGPVADVYSLGAILYECLTGRPPFHAATPVDTIVQALNEEVVAPRRLQPNVPRDLETICLKCLRKDPARRYATADELAEDLRRLLSGESIKARPVGPVERSVRWARRRPAAAALLGVTTLAALVILVGGWASSARLRTALADTQEQRGLADIRRQEAEGERQRAQDAAAEADRQRQAAVASAAEADRQRQAVATSLRNRLDVVDDILFNMDARLENASGMESIRREFLDEVRRFSDQLLKENPDDPSVMRQSGRVYRSIGALVRRDTRQSDDAYRKALSLGKQLTEKFPDNTEYLAELTKTAAGRAMMLWTARRYKEAAGAYAEATELTDRLVDRPGQPRATVHAARRRYYHANVLEDLKQPADAVRLYRDALARQEKLATAAPTDTDLLEDLGKTAASLALAVEPTDPNEAARLLRRALDVHRKVARLAPHSSGYK